MFEAFKQHILNYNLFSPNERLLLAVSGGIDSMVMMHLIKQLGISFGVAHCNFQLRDKESDVDALFVKTSAEMMDVPFYMARFETGDYARENNLSIQMAARELRYTWFENIRKTHAYHAIATAHNADDSLETFLINLSRGCGIDGLTGIKPKSGNIIRPLLFAARNEIVDYSRRKGVNFREDSSNASDKYLRNFIRHNVLPVMDEAHSNFRKGIHTTIQNLISSQALYTFLIEKTKQELVREIYDAVYIDLEKLKTLPQNPGILWEILSGYNFNRDTCIEISSSLNAQPGKIFLSPSHRLIKDRKELIITKLRKQDKQIFYVEPHQIPAETPFNIDFTILEGLQNEALSREPQTAMLDFNKLEWPLILRKWQQGDYFAPLGMENLKKISDFLIDQKLSLYDKDNTWVLESGNHIIWVLGRRIDHRFRVTENTGKILRITISKKSELQ